MTAASAGSTIPKRRRIGACIWRSTAGSFATPRATAATRPCVRWSARCTSSRARPTARVSRRTRSAGRAAPGGLPAATAPGAGARRRVRAPPPPLVKRALWDRVQARLTTNKRATVHTAGGYPLRNLITCATCGAPYKGSGGPRGPANEPDRYRFYREGGTAEGRCGHRQGTLQKRIVEPLVIAEVAKVVAHPKVQRLVAEALDRLLGAVPDSRRALDKERADLEAQRKRLVERIGAGLIADAEAKPVLADIRARLDAVAAQGEQAKFTVANRKALAAERERLVGMAKDFGARARKLSGAALRELLRPW